MVAVILKTKLLYDSVGLPGLEKSFLHLEVKGEIFLSVSIVQFSSMLSTGCFLAVFFVAAFKKFSRKRRAIIFNNAITIRGRCLS